MHAWLFAVLALGGDPAKRLEVNDESHPARARIADHSSPAPGSGCVTRTRRAPRPPLGVSVRLEAVPRFSSSASALSVPDRRRLREPPCSSVMRPKETGEVSGSAGSTSCASSPQSAVTPAVAAKRTPDLMTSWTGSGIGTGNAAWRPCTVAELTIAGIAATARSSVRSTSRRKSRRCDATSAGLSCSSMTRPSRIAMKARAARALATFFSWRAGSCVRVRPRVLRRPRLPAIAPVGVPCSIRVPRAATAGPLRRTVGVNPLGPG